MNLRPPGWCTIFMITCSTMMNKYCLCINLTFLYCQFPDITAIDNNIDSANYFVLSSNLTPAASSDNMGHSCISTQVSTTAASVHSINSISASQGSNGLSISPSTDSHPLPVNSLFHQSPSHFSSQSPLPAINHQSLIHHPTCSRSSTGSTTSSTPSQLTSLSTSSISISCEPENSLSNNIPHITAALTVNQLTPPQESLPPGGGGIASAGGSNLNTSPDMSYYQSYPFDCRSPPNEYKPSSYSASCSPIANQQVSHLAVAKFS